MNDDNTTFGTLDRIKAAGTKFIGSLKAKREAISALYAVYLDALRDKQVAAAIDDDFGRLPKPPRSTNLAARIAYLAVTLERRRASEIKETLESANAAKISAEGMYDWQVKRAQEETGNRKARGDEKQLAIHKIATRLYANANNKTKLDKSPIPVACEPGDYLVQVCQRQPNGNWLSSWIKASKDEFEFVSRATLTEPTVPASRPEASYDEIVESARLAA